MYLPAAFDEPDVGRLHRLIDDIAIAILVSAGADGLEASHLPVLLDAGAGPHGTILGHLARANPHWRRLDGGEVLLVLQGPNGYVSPNWYPTKQETGMVVPTWNYVAVHVTGEARTFDDRDSLRDLVTRLTERHERRFAAPWSVADAPAGFVDRMLGQIVGVAVRITRLEGKLKLSQNRPPEDRRGVVAGLDATGDAGDALLAAAMRRLSEI